MSISKRVNHIVICLLHCIPLGIFAQNADNNLALHLDGEDNQIRTGIGIMKAPWTLEAWIKGNDTSWKEEEVIFGGGEYSALNTAENLPLVIKKGKLHSAGAQLLSPTILNDQWHHVAISCNGVFTHLYLDGVKICSKRIAFPIIPGAIGVCENRKTAFGGWVDEVRIWQTEVAAQTIQKWAHQSINPSHPNFKKIVAYYNFNDGIDKSAINWVGKGSQAYHLRNGRNNYKGQKPLAYTEINDNPKFVKPAKEQKLFNAITIHSEWDIDQGASDNAILKLRIAVTGSLTPLALTGITLDLSSVSALSDISRIHIYHTGKTAHSTIKSEIFGKGTIPSKKIVLSERNTPIRLSAGINYFLITADFSAKAAIGNKIKIDIPVFELNNRHYTPETTNSSIAPTITPNNYTDANIIKVLQWNIWHGGIHVGNNGINNIINLIKATHADIITMQEAYGSQLRIAESLNYFLSTASSNDNLAIYSRFPIAKHLPPYSTFNSNPVILTLPNSKKILVNACWLRYATNPEYTSLYPNKGSNTNLWIAKDSMSNLLDIHEIISKDTEPYLKDSNIPVIIGGDFNSCSHLDWTKAAIPLHFGYGPVAFPTSRYLLAKGYKDSFREINPNEVAQSEGTWSPIYGQLPACRIDFIYYKGCGIKAITSKIIRTAPDIDDVWPSDHAGVLTTFQLTND
ncbi:endonuclease/exonuclease/phosphatase family protein [Niabella sp. CJ426]|uniref:endonuclease/exonuclease/phosphatase family protein n=1 Tax=Niabella sp. CJ426 TaxID=3393740 RepID=UPI003CFE85A7